MRYSASSQEAASCQRLLVAEAGEVAIVMSGMSGVALDIGGLKYNP